MPFDPVNSPMSPANVKVVRRAEYAIVWWDRVILSVVGAPVIVNQYNVYRSSYINEAQLELVKEIRTTDTAGFVDVVVIDVRLDETASYRVQASIDNVPTPYESEVSPPSIAIKESSQIDDKLELLNRRIFRLDQGRLDEGLLV